jgi:hypothetical protein
MGMDVLAAWCAADHCVVLPLYFHRIKGEAIYRKAALLFAAPKYSSPGDRVCECCVEFFTELLSSPPAYIAVVGTDKESHHPYSITNKHK